MAQSALQRARNAAQKTKTRMCHGKATKAQVRTAVRKYEKLAIKAGQPAKEAKRKANAILNRGCQMSAVAGTKRKTKRKTKRRTR